ncbi:hypothetical protein CKO38_15295 [Rhodospirillum rubrum]|uniref:helix-turn-helix domain-containing protein n=1 Tax=Rhodospirillum rubrum TaxID=1085 RepID=UPI00190656CA|nr:helix-turn-helix domain-containing protein [Rhodospirillum rubrum]MBK1666420.1 hypothetical protein [Rhodospirillum rubrum]MBK1678012.1 hypothetical protein [Rhodospirillum rubrum]
MIPSVRPPAGASAQSQEDLILDHLESGRALNAAQAWTLYDCQRLAARIHTLRARGYRIDTRRQGGAALYQLDDYLTEATATAGPSLGDP